MGDELGHAYTITPGGYLGGEYVVCGPDGRGELMRSPEIDACNAAIREDMEREQYWPEVYWISDHGNVQVHSVAGES